MGRNRIFYITKALMLSSCMMFGLFVTTGTVTAYAASDGNQEAENSDKSGNNHTDSEEESELIDYDFEISTEEIDFGTVIRGDEVDPIEFTVTNVGETEITLDYKAEDGDEDAFKVEPVTDGKEIVFRVSVEDNLDPGDYSVTYDFYPLEDPESEAKVAVTFSVSVIEPVPYISKVVVSPSSASVILGKNYAFNATVYGGDGYDPDVFWEVTGQKSPYTKISQDGILTIGSDESASSLTVIATSKQDWHYKGEASVQFIEHEIQLSAEPSDGGTVSGGGTVKYGGSIKATATSSDYYTFSGWYEGSSLVSTSSQIQISNVTYDRSFTAVFKKARYTVSATVSPSGAGKVENTGTYDAGEEVALRAVPNEGYDFIGWILNNQNVSGDLEYVYGPLEKNVSVTAQFKAKEARTIRIESGIANEGGKISPNGDNYVQEGKSATYKMIPDSGYRVRAVAVDGVNIGAMDSYTFNDVYEEHSIAVSFEAIPEEIAAPSVSRGNNAEPEEEDFEEDDLNKTPEEIEAEKERAVNEAEDEQINPGLIERINKEETTEGTSEEKTEEENKDISGRELYDNTFTIEDESAPLAASAEPLASSKSKMARKSNFVLEIVIIGLFSVVLYSIGYTYFWLFKKKPSDKDSE
ncbi:MAG: InlB B-repeat-containing protein [Butyrivibrio sp.]|nr:InlB B-repeat-containing protein [Butyrivibrio sp.]